MQRFRLCQKQTQFAIFSCGMIENTAMYTNAAQRRISAKQKKQKKKTKRNIEQENGLE